MAAYADVAAVKARLGRYASLLAAAASAQHPNEDDATDLLADVSAEIDLALKSRGWDPATLDATAKTGLKDLAAFGAISRLLSGYPADADLDKAADYAAKVWRAAMGDPAATEAAAVAGTIRAGSHPVVAALEAGQAGGGAGSSGGSFWGDEPGFGTDAQVAAEALSLTRSTAPGFSKGMRG